MTGGATEADGALHQRVHGVDLDPETRCAHYHGALDIIAIRLRCCGEYYACSECHDALADHRIEGWPPDEHDAPEVLCGACRHELTVREYLACGNRCPRCAAGFNPNCSLHYHIYFAAS